MRYRWLLWGTAYGLGFAIVGFGLRTLGLDYPLGGLFTWLTHFFGVPEVFNYVHQLLGYGDDAKNLAFIGSIGLWIAVHVALLGAYSRIGALAVALAVIFYLVFSDFLAATVYALLFWAVALQVWWSAPARFDVERRTTLRTLAGAALAVAGLLGGVRFIMDWLMRKAMVDESARAADIDPSPGEVTTWERIDGLSEEITSQDDLYYVSKNPELLDPDIMAGMYSLSIGGRVRAPIELSYEELTALPSRQMTRTLMCISNPVGGDLIGTPVWTGVPVAALLERAGFEPGDNGLWLDFRAADDYDESIPLAELPEDALVAYAINGEPLWRKHGYPTRLLLPGRYGMKQPKWLTSIDVVDRGAIGYWAERGWSRSAFVRPMSRIDTPGRDARVPVGATVPVAGIAFAGGRDIAAVQVSTDGGDTWRDAALKAPIAERAWRLWALEWQPETAGPYMLVVRAVLEGGEEQTAERTPPLPDGATGYHHVPVVAGAASAVGVRSTPRT